MKASPKTFVIGDVHGRRAQFKQLVEMLPRDEAKDTLVILGDLVDRGDDVPGVISDLIELQRGQPERVVVLRGNHEQMLLDFIDGRSDLWLHPAVGSELTFEQYAGRPLGVAVRENYDVAQERVAQLIPPEHIEFFRRLPFYYEDDYALYVHAGLDHGKHPRDTDPHHLMWSRDEDFFRRYYGKPCVFGHTP
ncbi:MAG: serine/threonine protein phosphatase, partial [Pyrinomonadaceae bacterium]|nr:serine/threonine protein phosphatase [Pyrinomonadaceae bacterium]